LLGLCTLSAFAGCSHNFDFNNPLDPKAVGIIAGKVIEASTGRGISDASVSISPCASPVKSDADGNYSINNVRMGTYTVTAVKFGYGGNSATVKVNTALEPSIADVKLSVYDFEMISIPAGNFKMGSNASDPYCSSDETPQHNVYLTAYQIGKYEITNIQYKVFMDAGGYSNSCYWTVDGWTWRTENGITSPAYWSSGRYNSGTAYPVYPVTCISWYEADAFCRWAGGRLPTEAEWEKAARGTDSSNCWPWGGAWDSTVCNAGCGFIYPDAYPDTFTYSSPVGCFNAGVSVYGVYDMAGNIYEWINDWYDPNYYSISPASNPAGPSAEETAGYKVIRGGSFTNDAADCRTGSRDRFVPNFRNPGIGFRIAK
jgi:formylglycine-generating enzyme required for sulfatase activity